METRKAGSIFTAIASEKNWLCWSARIYSELVLSSQVLHNSGYNFKRGILIQKHTESCRKHISFDLQFAVSPMSTNNPVFPNGADLKTCLQIQSCFPSNLCHYNEEQQSKHQSERALSFDAWHEYKFIQSSVCIPLYLHFYMQLHPPPSHRMRSFPRMFKG